ncbi:hypothetical protein [Mycobacterium paragordonae]|uniref:Uncharacterized protein n=1 Tax=Mycobacterium paragordonae TaxID=1389713 RepID=A0A4R5WJX8_9MYCO|nr:hypothetical protein [Mycobacterium paragordonae]MDP7738987.1 hypothetical protein [Mycobacterium paragordonae]TDK90279.1 hypothetical protein EUA02_23880 [Mycobacterium paragordonae]TDL03096.1 hypothetical protein EUA05_25635 [Mycobacterium paragordonae]
MTSNITPDSVLADKMLGVVTTVRVYQQLIEHLEGDGCGGIYTVPAFVRGDGDTDGVREALCRQVHALGGTLANALIGAVGREEALRAVQRAYGAAIARDEGRRAEIVASIERDRRWLLDHYGTETSAERVRSGEFPVEDTAMAVLLDTGNEARR